MPRTQGKTEKNASRAKSETNVGRKKHRFKPGTCALREIRRFQKSFDLLIPRRPFERLVREISQKLYFNIRFTREAISVLHSATEAYLTSCFAAGNLSAIHGKRVTMMVRDVEFVKKADFGPQLRI